MSHLHIARLEPVSQEHRAAYAALRFTNTHLNGVFQEFTDGRGIRLDEFRRALEGLDDTYIVRLFAGFEHLLREYLESQGVRVPGRMYDVLNRVASRLHMDAEVRDNAHLVRERRNAIVHDGGQGAPPMTYATARRTISRFLAWLP